MPQLTKNALHGKMEVNKRVPEGTMTSIAPTTPKRSSFSSMKNDDNECIGIASDNGVFNKNSLSSRVLPEEDPIPRSGSSTVSGSLTTTLGALSDILESDLWISNDGIGQKSSQRNDNSYSARTTPIHNETTGQKCEKMDSPNLSLNRPLSMSWDLELHAKLMVDEERKDSIENAGKICSLEKSILGSNDSFSRLLNIETTPNRCIQSENSTMSKSTDKNGSYKKALAEMKISSKKSSRASGETVEPGDDSEFDCKQSGATSIHKKHKDFSIKEKLRKKRCLCIHSKVTKRLKNSPRGRSARRQTKKDYVADISRFDVLCERGGKGNNHPGNKTYLELVEDAKPIYQSLPKAKSANKEKAEISEQIVQQIHNSGGRFLEMEKDANGKKQYYVLSKEEARKDKVGQALRNQKKGKNAQKL